jgi:hypothetical protein
MNLKNIYCGSLSLIGNLLYKNQKIPKSFLGNSILDIYFCPFLKNPEKSWEKISVVTINYFYRLMTEKIIFILLA